MKFLQLAIVLFCIVCLLKADIPTHCLKSQVTGKWEFKATKPVKKSIAQLYKLTCGHPNPSHESSAHKMNMDLSEFTERFEIDLQKSDDASAVILGKHRVFFILLRLVNGRWYMTRVSTW